MGGLQERQRRAEEAGTAAVPSSIRTENLCLRAWRKEDAPLLLPVLEANVTRLIGWIPRHVAAPAPLPDLEMRLSRFAADFEAARECRFAILSPDERQLFGEVDLFFRSATGRVPFDAADRLEIGYWLRSEATGRGYATEAARAMIGIGGRLPGMRHIEIRCDPRNVASAAVPRRLGFGRGEVGGGGVDGFTAGGFTAGDITAGDITAGDITAGDPTAGESTAGESTAGDLVVWVLELR